MSMGIDLPVHRSLLFVPGNRPERFDKALRLAAYRGGATEAEMRTVIAQVWGLAGAAKALRFFS